MQAEKLRAHLADDTGDVVAVLGELVEIREAAQALVALKLRHAAAHDRDATHQRRALFGGAAAGHANHGGRITDEIVLGRQHPRREQRREIARELRGVLLAVDDRHEARVKLRLLLGLQARVVLDRVRDATEQVRVRHHERERLRQDGNRQSERARNARQNAALIGEIVVGRADCSARFGHHEGSRRARRFGVRMARDDNTGLS